MTRLLVFLSLLCATARAEPLPLVVVLHGYGATPEDIAPIVAGLPVKVRVVTPHGATPVGNGFSWFPSAHESQSAFEMGLLAASNAVAQRIVDEERMHPGCGKPIVIGFSQGGFLSYAIAVRPSPVVGLALPIGGFLPSALRPKTKPTNAPRIVAFHGEDDHRVELATDRATQAQLVGLGYTSVLHTYPGLGHSVSPDEARELRSAITDYVRAEGCAR